MLLSSVGKQSDLENRSERWLESDHVRRIRVFSNLILFTRSFQSMEGTYVCLRFGGSDNFFNPEFFSLRFSFQPCNKSGTKFYSDSCVRLRCRPGVFVFVFISTKFFIFAQDEMNCSTLYSCLKIIELHSTEVSFPRSMWGWRCKPDPLVSNDSPSGWVQAKSPLMMYLIEDDSCHLTDVVDSSDSVVDLHRWNDRNIHLDVSLINQSILEIISVKKCSSHRDHFTQSGNLQTRDSLSLITIWLRLFFE